MEYSCLYNIEPIGLNTAQCESLSSYIGRLADAHCVSTGQLISKICTPYLNKKYLTQIAIKGGNGFYDSASGINGIGIMATYFSEMINSLTSRNDLCNLTWLNGLNILTTRGLLRKIRVWCPNCYEETLLSDSAIYDRLIWTLKDMTYCPEHKIKLVELCPSCGRKMQVLARSYRPGYCQYCSSWLGFMINPEQEEVFMNEFLISNCLKGILEEGFLKLTLNQDSLIKSINYYVSVHFNNESVSMAKYLNVSKSTFWGWQNGKNLPPLLQLVNMMIMLGTTFKGFFKRESATLSSLTINPPLKKNRVHYDHERIQYLLNEALRENNQEISIKSIAENIGCDRRLLYLLYPEEIKILSLRYSIKLSKKTTLRRGNLQKEIGEAVQVLMNLDIIPSKRKVENFLGKPALLRETELENFLKTIEKFT